MDVSCDHSVAIKETATTTTTACCNFCFAFIEKSDAKVGQLGTAIAELESDIDRLTAEKNDATAVREKEHAEYLKVSTDYSESD